MRRDEESRPEMFVALDPSHPAPSEGPARCGICDNILVFVPEQPLKPSEPVRNRGPLKATAPPEPELFQPEPQEPLTAPVVRSLAPSASVEVLWELGAGEELKAFHDNANEYLIVTSKRIVRINKYG